LHADHTEKHLHDVQSRDENINEKITPRDFDESEEELEEVD